MKGILHRRIFAADKEIFREGDEADTAYLVRSGTVTITKETDGRQQVIAVVGENEMFGEMVLIDDAPRMATATAVDTTECTVISRARLQAKLQAIDGSSRSVIEFLIHYIRHTLPYELRRKSDGRAPGGGEDLTASQVLNTPHVAEVLRQRDRFLLALYEVLSGYVERRLPPDLRPK